MSLVELCTITHIICACTFIIRNVEITSYYIYVSKNKEASTMLCDYTWIVESGQYVIEWRCGPLCCIDDGDTICARLQYLFSHRTRATNNKNQRQGGRETTVTQVVVVHS